MTINRVKTEGQTQFYVLDLDTNIVAAQLSAVSKGFKIAYDADLASVGISVPTADKLASVVGTVIEGSFTLSEIMGALRPTAREFGYSDSDIVIKISNETLTFEIPIESYVPSAVKRLKTYDIATLQEVI